MLKIVAKDMESYRNFIIDSLMQNPAISGVDTSIVMSTEKELSVCQLMKCRRLLI